MDKLTEQLETLKQEGANLLVLAGPSESQSCHGLLGADQLGRRRLYVTTEASASKLRELSGSERTPDRFGHVHITTGMTRGSSVQSTDGGETQWAPATVTPTRDETYSQVADPSDLKTLAQHVHDHLLRFENHDVEPGDVRLCFDSLDPLIDVAEKRDLQRFLQTVTMRIRLARGMAHYHLTVQAARQIPDAIAPLFDGVIERRQTPNGPRQRWTLRESGIQTDWLPIF